MIENLSNAVKNILKHRLTVYGWKENVLRIKNMLGVIVLKCTDFELCSTNWTSEDDQSVLGRNVVSLKTSLSTKVVRNKKRILTGPH